MSESLPEKPIFVEMTPPEIESIVVTLPPSTSGPRVSPRQQVYLYDDVMWEEFAREWVTATKGDEYIKVGRYGGAGDLGIDIAALLTSQGLFGPWDCFQCKHYGQSLMPSDAMPEIFKLLRFATAGKYLLPRTYYFVAPRNCGPTLQRLLDSPPELRSHFIEEMTKDKSTLRKNAEAADFERVLSYAQDKCDFSIFSSVSIDDMMESHSKTKYHIVRFGEVLPTRPAVDKPTDELGAHEARYVEQLMEVYEEKYPGSGFDPDSVLTHPKLGEHFRRQREDFFSAESLMNFARDSVPDETFKSLQDEVFSGVIDVAELHHASGMERLSRVLNAAVSVELTSNVLLSRARVHDRKGMCHQLANVDRLTWCQGDES
ncbi:ABC-three component system protein [Umezawaea sp. Da 62-37]|uniref:ABC-three component system protein n=1 Tax=Umezawaea sp. Da 62-37 TaxID=3075927 RepID=UPI0028F71B91|nr:ABC-three component system protein [Umezawaea sp. Da 62-37]WNV82149.1 hypothetical protein RM788_28500 [Umezawaea sp. Da 62-37]